MPSSKPPSRGFTLLEMIVVLGIVAIVVALALPRISVITMRQRVNRDAYVVVSDLRSAFTSAARGRVPVKVTIPGDTTAYTITNQATGEKIVKRSFTADKISVAGNTAAAFTMVIFPDGVAAGVDTVVVGTSTYKKKISVSRVGFIRMVP